MIRFIYFDLDDTLLDHHHAQEQALAACFTAFDWGMATLTELQAVYHHINVRLWADYAQGRVSKMELNSQRFSETIATLEASVTEEDFRHLYLNHYSKCWRYIAGADHAFRTLANRFPVGILTNGFVEIQSEKLARFPELRAYSKEVVISEEVGVLKPHPTLFRWAAEKTGVTPAEILCVGDSLASDVMGSLRAGWQAAWFRPSATTAEIPIGAFAFARWEELFRFVSEQSD
ncbi:MAG: HAD family hydrolase [Bacteroidetes Order II. Incertae sedis bacterium]|nr:HAD family hydrolase [Bacteroidetes Order II. bacterium]